METRPACISSKACSCWQGWRRERRSEGIKGPRGLSVCIVDLFLPVRCAALACHELAMSRILKVNTFTFNYKAKSDRRQGSRLDRENRNEHNPGRKQTM